MKQLMSVEQRGRGEISFQKEWKCHREKIWTLKIKSPGTSVHKQVGECQDEQRGTEVKRWWNISCDMPSKPREIGPVGKQFHQIEEYSIWGRYPQLVSQLVKCNKNKLLVAMLYDYKKFFRAEEAKGNGMKTLGSNCAVQIAWSNQCLTRAI